MAGASPISRPVVASPPPPPPNNPDFSSISLYARPSNDPLQLMFSAMIADHHLGEIGSSQGDSREEEGGEGEGWSLPQGAETNWSVHSPQVRTVFHELKSKLKDLDAIYQEKDDGDEVKFVPTDAVMAHKKALDKEIEFFSDLMFKNFDQFVHFQNKCEKEQMFLSRCESLLETFENPDVEQEEFSQCASGICDTLSSFTALMQNSVLSSKRQTDRFYSQYKGIRDMLKPVQRVQAEMVCSVCMSSEIQTALSCGHVFCNCCSNKCNVCPQCREVIQKRTKLYF